MSLHIEDQLDAYIDGELSAEKRRSVEAHLDGCATCRQSLEQRRALSALLQAWPTAAGLAPAAEQARRVRVQIDALEPSASSRAVRRLHWAWAALPLMLVAGWAFWFTAALIAPLLEAVPGGAQALAGLLPVISVDALTNPFGSALPVDLRTLALPAAAGLGAPALLIALALLYLAWMSLLLARQRTGLMLTNE